MALTETTHAGGYILSEANGCMSRDNGNLNSGQNCVAGTVLGQIKTGAAAKISGTGDGNVAGAAVTLGPDAQVGVYILTGKTESGNAGTFSVRTPSADQLPDLTVASTYNSTHFSVTIPDGANDWDIGDIIHITVTGGDYEQLDPAATDGTQTAAGILYAPVNASAADRACVVTARHTDCNSNEIVWPAGITTAQKSVATQQLKSRGIRLS